MDNPNWTRYYNLHGIRLAVSCDAPIARVLDSRLAPFVAASFDAADVTFEFASVPEGARPAIERPSEPTRPVYDAPLGEVIYAEKGDRLYIGYDGDVRVRCDATAGQTRVSSRSAKGNNLWLLSHPLFTLPLTEVLKRRGMYALHAAALALNGQCLFIAGTSGAGKSTLTLALLRAGLDYLGDDMVLLKHKSTGLDALAFPEEIDLTNDTVAMFPELADLMQLPQPHGWRKRQVRADSVFNAQTVMSSVPRVLVFPHVANTSRSVIEAMTAEEVFLELVPNVLLTETRSSQAHLDILAALARKCSGYRLETGRDLHTVPLRLRELLVH